MRGVAICVAWFVALATVNAQDTSKVELIDASSEYSCYYSINGKPILVSSVEEIKKKMALHRWGNNKCRLLELDSCRIDFRKYGLVVWDTITDIPRSQITTNLYELRKEKKYLFVVKMNRPQFSQMVERGFAIRALVPRLKRKYKFEFLVQK